MGSTRETLLRPPVLHGAKAVGSFLCVEKTKFEHASIRILRARSVKRNFPENVGIPLNLQCLPTLSESNSVDYATDSHD